MSSTEISAQVLSSHPDESGSAPLFHFRNAYNQLPDRFYGRVNPTRVAAPRLIKVNAELAQSLGLDPAALASEEGVQVLSGNQVPTGSQPVALAYAGHQFGYFVPQLGDGRAILLGEVLGLDGKRYDIQLKGSGRTPFSRGGDGRAAVGPVLREYLLSEAIAALGVPTTRALAAVTTGEQVFRETALPGAVFTRVAASHMRVGTFQYFAARQDTEGLRQLADYAIARHYPEAAQAGQPYQALLNGIIGRQAKLVAEWMLLGFIHGVMNTDNMSISGETIDYGPCAFMEAYDPDAVFSSIDRQGRYAYSNQPNAALWNLTRLAESLLPLLEQEQESQAAALTVAEEALTTFAPRFDATRDAGFRRKLGLAEEREGDAELANTLLERMAANNADFTLVFRRLSDAAENPNRDREVGALFANPNDFFSWAATWRDRTQQESTPAHERAAAMRQVSPLVIPRNHLVEAVIVAAVTREDFQPFEELLDAVLHPFEDKPGVERFSTPANPEERVTRTFCGT